MYFKKYEKQLKNYFDTRKEEEDNIDNNITNASKEIFNTLLNNFDKPSVLYRYKPFNKFVQDELENNYIYLSDIPSFNDPYDCLGYMTDNFMTNNFFYSTSILKFDKYLQIYLQSRDMYLEACKENNIREFATDFFDYIDDTITMDDILEIFEYLEEAYQKHENNIPIVDMYSQACLKISKIVYAEYKHLKTKHLRVTCFSETNNNIPMWAHYANKGKGICIEYDISILKSNSLTISDSRNQNFKAKLLKAFYTNDFKYALTGFSEEDILFSSIFKQSDWNYEKEWRFSIYDSEECSKQNSRFYGLPIKAIYIGYNNNEHEISNIKDCLDNMRNISNNNIPIYRMITHNNGLLNQKISDNK